jgi:gluconate 5-dehydrogenase
MNSPDALFSVKGQIVLVSGGSRGIGRSIAQGFCERGAQVIITGREPDSLEATAAEIAKASGESCLKPATVVCDVLDATAIKSCVETVLKDFGRIDTLVNVAGVNRRKPALKMTEEDYDFVMDINLKGAYLMSIEVGRHMTASRKGIQINVASINTDRPLKNVSPYAMSKAAMGHMTRGLALEWGPLGVRVNAIAPGFILTDLTKKLWEDKALQEWGAFNTPQGRLGQPDDMIGTAIFLASPASAFMTGQILYVDGGYTAGWRWPIPE